MQVTLSRNLCITFPTKENTSDRCLPGVCVRENNNISLENDRRQKSMNDATRASSSKVFSRYTSVSPRSIAIQRIRRKRSADRATNYFIAYSSSGLTFQGWINKLTSNINFSSTNNTGLHRGSMNVEYQVR